MKLLYYVFIILLVSCHSSKVSNVTRAAVGEAWRVPDENATKILARLNRCGLFRKCNGTGNGYRNEAEYKYVIDKYGAENVTTVPARYRKADQKSYASLWGLDPASADAKVKGYKTTLLKADDHKSPTAYYFVVKLCPPPRHCAADSLH